MEHGWNPIQVLFQGRSYSAYWFIHVNHNEHVRLAASRHWQCFIFIDKKTEYPSLLPEWTIPAPVWYQVTEFYFGFNAAQSIVQGVIPISPF